MKVIKRSKKQGEYTVRVCDRDGKPFTGCVRDELSGQVYDLCSDRYLSMTRLTGFRATDPRVQ